MKTYAFEWISAPNDTTYRVHFFEYSGIEDCRRVSVDVPDVGQSPEALIAAATRLLD